MSSPVDPSYINAQQDVGILGQDLLDPNSPSVNDDMNMLKNDMLTVYNNPNIPDNLKQSLNQSIQSLPSGSPNALKILSNLLTHASTLGDVPQTLEQFLATNMIDVTNARIAFQNNPNSQTLKTLQDALKKSQTALGGLIGKFSSLSAPSGIDPATWQKMQGELGNAYSGIAMALRSLSTNGVNTQLSTLNIGSSSDPAEWALFSDPNI
jgi:hypothetical protein